MSFLYTGQATDCRVSTDPDCWLDTVETPPAMTPVDPALLAEIDARLEAERGPSTTSKIVSAASVLAGLWMLTKGSQLVGSPFFSRVGAAVLIGIGGLNLLRR